MTTKTWGIFNSVTGILRGNYSGPEGTVEVQLRPGEVSVEGSFNGELVRFNAQLNQVQAFIPSSPGADYLWDQTRWILTPLASARRSRSETALAKIAKLEAGQARTLRDLALGRPGALERLTTVDAAIAILRPDITE